MDVSYRIIIPTKIGMADMLLPEQLRPARDYYGSDEKHTTALMLEIDGVEHFVPLDSVELAGLEDMIKKARKLMPLQQAKVILIPKPEIIRDARPENN